MTTGSSTYPGRRVGSSADTSASRGEAFFTRFIKSKGPIAGEYRLNMRNVFVLPSQAGALFGAVLFAMLICSINYGLALGYGLSFLIFGAAVVGMMHTFRNMSALSFRPGRSEPVFAGQMADATLMVKNASTLDRFALRIDADSMTRTESVDVPAKSEQLIRIAIPAPERGWMSLPRLTMSTRFPLGIWRAWAYWHPAQRVLVYPQAETPAVPLPDSLSNEGDGQGSGGLEEDLAGVRPFQAGDTPRRIAWTAMARTGTDEMLTKHFEGGATGELSLDFEKLPGTLTLEDRLSRLTRWVLDAEAVGTRYELNLPGMQIEADSGVAHKIKCLEALALYGTRS
jgi:uncharacterized protein (DUF58 family)